MSFLDLAYARYSVRHYEDRSVEQEKVDAIVEAGRIAPSAHNFHPTRIVVCDTPELLAKAAACEPRFEKNGSIFGAPLAFVVCAKTEDAWVRSYDDMNSSLIDTSIVCDQMMMAATDLGLGTCWVCAFDPEVARREFDIPEGVEPVSILVAGYAQPRELDSERREARRIPLAQFTDVNA
ncbi:hypothetical protein DMP06_00730 [Slackia equolifaciens]|uniref:Nitroreductase domain-containing protein n=1 Tax=Slackia equolifaciens TaxID=498718 RepID=A0A3N0B4C5_9ACTN|nr:nitroreductase family protein [Slackia equolifaciens]RNL41965.1 hypothetical protein DMP06_00730 [Slackia equolifaciens]